MAYLYRHIRLDKNEPFYIGVGGLFDFDNYERAHKKFNRNKLWINIVKKSKYEVEIMLDDLTNEEVFKKEVEFIKLYGRIDLKTGILANLTEGGEGRSSITSEETKLKISKSNKDKSKPIDFGNKIRKILTGRKRPKEVIEKMVANRAGFKHTEESKLKIKLATQGSNNPFYGKKQLKWVVDMHSKQVLNTETGIFYDSIKEACKSTNYKYDYFKMMLRNDRPNKTKFIQC